MSTVYEIEDARLVVDIHANTIEITGFQNVVDLSEDGEDGEYLTHHETYSGYTLSECICKALMSMDLADNWFYAISMIEDAGIAYVSSEDF